MVIKKNKETKKELSTHHKKMAVQKEAVKQNKKPIPPLPVLPEEHDNPHIIDEHGDY